MKTLKSKKWIGAVFKVLVSASLLSYVLLTNDIVRALDYIALITVPFWLIFFSLAFFSLVFLAFRLSIFLPSIKLTTLMYARIVSYAYGFVLPGQIAAEGVRVYLLGKSGGGHSRVGTAVMLEKIISVFSVLMMGVLGVVASGSVGQGAAVFFLVPFAVLALLIFALQMPFLHKKIKMLLCALSGRPAWQGKLFGVLHGVFENWHVFLGEKRLLLICFILGLILHLIFSSVGMLLTYIVGAGFMFYEWLWIQSALTLVLLFPISLGGVGVREGSIIGFLSFVNVAEEQALAVAFGFFLWNILFVIAGFGVEIFAALLRKKPGD